MLPGRCILVPVEVLYSGQTGEGPDIPDVGESLSVGAVDAVGRQVYGLRGVDQAIAILVADNDDVGRSDHPLETHGQGVVGCDPAWLADEEVDVKISRDRAVGQLSRIELEDRLSNLKQ